MSWDVAGLVLAGLLLGSAQLRRKLEDDPAHPRHIRTQPGMGYTFEV